MKHMRKLIWVLVLALAMNLCLAVSAAEDPTGIWLNTEETGNEVIVSVCSNTVIADGLIKLSFDSSALTFVDLTVDSRYVAAHAVNPQESGVVKITWIAPGEYQLEEESHVLMQLRFTGTMPEELTLSGVVHTPTGDTVPVADLDFEPLEAAVAAAQALNKEEYTEESFAAVEAALTEALAVLADELVTQAELDAALEKLNTAVAGLEEAPTENPGGDSDNNPTNPTDPTDPTDPGEGPTDPGENDEKPGLGLWIGIGAAVVVAAAVVVVVVLKKKKGAA